MISIYFKSGEPKFYESFEEIVSLENYDLIISIICRSSNVVSLPSPLPRMLKRLYCENNHITSLPELPHCLKELRCSENQLEYLPKLPYVIEELYCSHNNLKELPELVFNDYLKFGIDTENEKYMEGGSLRKVYCDNNKLSTLPKLPYTLNTIQCSHNNITEFPELPSNINNVDISHNALKSIPKELYKLWYLDFIDYSYNEVSTSLPWFADDLRFLICNNNPITYLYDKLPDNLQIFNCGNTNIRNIPNFPKYMRKLICDPELTENIEKKFPEIFKK